MATATLRPRPVRRRYDGLDLVHYPLTIAVPKLSIPSVVTIHDLQHLELPQLFSRSERLFRRRAYEGSARHGGDRRRAEPVRAAQRRSSGSGLPPQRVHAIPHGIDHERFTPGDGPREPFLLYPGRPWPHKNHARLFEAFELLRRERPRARARADRRWARHAAGPGRCAGCWARRGGRARLALPARGVPGLSEPLRGVRPAAARGDGVRLPGRCLQRRRDPRGGRRGGGALRPRGCGGHRGRRPGRAREPRPDSSRQGSSGPRASHGRRRRAATRRSTVRSGSARRSPASSGRRRPPSSRSHGCRSRGSCGFSIANANRFAWLGSTFVTRPTTGRSRRSAVAARPARLCHEYVGQLERAEVSDPVSGVRRVRGDGLLDLALRPAVDVVRRARVGDAACRESVGGDGRELVVVHRARPRAESHEGAVAALDRDDGDAADAVELEQRAVRRAAVVEARR